MAQWTCGHTDFFPHLSRLFLRANAQGIFISSAGFTEPVVKECTTALTQKTMVLCSLREIFLLLQWQGDLIAFLKKKGAQRSSTRIHTLNC